MRRPRAGAPPSTVHSLSNPFFLALKAALSAALAYAVVSAFGLFDTLSAPFVALACTSPVVMTGLRLGLHQIAASGIGGLVALGVLALLPNGAFALGLAVFLTLFAVHRFGLHQVFLVAGFTVLYAFLLPGITPDFAVEQRTLSLLAGVASATVVNTVVSAWAYRSIFLRRLRILRAQVGAGLGALVEATESEPKRRRASGSFDAVFPLLWALGAELGDARREGRFRRRVKVDLFELQEAVRLLALLSHLGKELGLHLESSDAPAVLRPHLEGLRAMFEGGPEPEVPERGPEWVGAYRRAVEACRALALVESLLARKSSADTDAQ